MNRILFVDDEVSILNGIRNALRRERHRWDMVFVTSAAAALDEMARAPFDLCISDMRMPVIDGADLLAQIKQRYPQTARIVLSGHSDRQAILRALPAANQFLAKPCAPEQLASIIERACALQNTLNSSAMRELVGGLDRLPSVPAVYHALTEAIANPGTHIDEITRILEQDPAMCVKVLQLVNSPYFGASKVVNSLRSAVVYLGLDLIKSLTLSAHVFSTLEVSGATRACLDKMRRHSFRVAHLARRFLAGSKDADDVFGIALVHDVGAIVLALLNADKYSSVIESGRLSGVPGHVAEVEAFGVSHAEIGAYLLGTWGLPFAMVEAVAYHHHPSPPSTGNRIIAALHVADAAILGEDADSEHSFDRDYMECAGLEAEADHWMRIAKELNEEVS